MAPKTADPSTVFTDAVIAGVKQSQELAFSGISMWIDFAGKVFTMPEMDSMPFADALPLADSLPSPKTLVESTFGFAEELLGTQKDFAVKVVELVVPAKKSA
jgi:hypothetical protein